jgi:hypothetical protein
MEPFSDAPIKANGILFGGDLHLSSQAPSTRRDDYLRAGLDKVRQMVEIAKAGRLVPVLTGDVVHRPQEPKEALKTRLLRELAKSELGFWTNVGNHDMTGLRLDDGDTLAAIAEPGYPLRAVAESGPGFMVDAGGTLIGVGFTPYGQEIPTDVRGVFPDAQAVFWVTHHDVGFEGAYPGAVMPHEILGCHLVVNGHMHLEKPQLQCGGTMWVNFGSLCRTAIDAVGHEPCVWSFTPGEGLVRHPLRFQRDVFDLTGSLIDKASPGEIVEPASPSAFVELMRQAKEEAMPATADGTVFLVALLDKLERAKASPQVRQMALDLHKRVTEKRAAAAA